MPVAKKNRYEHKTLKGTRYTDRVIELRRYSQRHNGLASTEKGAWGDFVGSVIGRAIDAFHREHGYRPDPQQLTIITEFTHTEMYVRVLDTVNLQCQDEAHDRSRDGRH